MRAFLFLALVVLAGCDITIGQAPPTQPTQPPPQQREVETTRSRGGLTNADFTFVVRRVEPVAEAMCRAERPRADCDFRIVVDGRAGQPPNAFQTLDEDGRPILGFTASFIETARNRDELAFVLGHEAAHHIRAHIPQSQDRATQGAILGGLLGAITGINPQGVDLASRIGANVGARRFSKSFELEADALGTVIAARAGFDPVLGAEFFNRIPDPGDRFLGSHPPNAERLEIVRRTARGL